MAGRRVCTATRWGRGSNPTRFWSTEVLPTTQFARLASSWGTHRSTCGARAMWRAGRALLRFGSSGLMTAESLRDAAVALVVSSCAAQGLPVKVTDPAVLGNVVTLLQTDRHEDAVGLYTPHGTNPLGIEAVVPAASAADHSVVEERADDGVLAAQR